MSRIRGAPAGGPSPRPAVGAVDERRRLLAEQLDAYMPVTDREEHDLAAMRLLVDGPGDPLSKRHFEPGHFTASGFVMSTDGTSMLLVLHRKLDRWLQPGGHVDAEDTGLARAARREVAEETGLSKIDLLGGGIFDIDAHPIPPHGTDPAHMHFDVRYLFAAQPVDPSPSDEVDDARWVPLGDVASLTNDASVRRAVSKLTSGSYLA